MNATWDTVDLAMLFRTSPEEIVELADAGELVAAKTADGRRHFTEAAVRDFMARNTVHA